MQEEVDLVDLERQMPKTTAYLYDDVHYTQAGNYLVETRSPTELSNRKRSTESWSGAKAERIPCPARARIGGQRGGSKSASTSPAPIRTKATRRRANAGIRSRIVPQLGGCPVPAGHFTKSAHVLGIVELIRLPPLRTGLLQPVSV